MSNHSPWTHEFENIACISASFRFAKTENSNLPSELSPEDLLKSIAPINFSLR